MSAEPLATCSAPAGLVQPGMGKVAIVGACLAAAIAALDADGAIVKRIPDAQRKHAASVLRISSTNTDTIGLHKVTCVRPHEFSFQLLVEPNDFQAEMHLSVAVAHLVTVGDEAFVLFSVVPGTNAIAPPATFLLYDFRSRLQEDSDEGHGRIIVFKTSVSAARYLTAACSEVAAPSSTLTPRCVIYHFALETHLPLAWPSPPMGTVILPPPHMGTFLTLPMHAVQGEHPEPAPLALPVDDIDPPVWAIGMRVPPPPVIVQPPAPTVLPVSSAATFTCTICMDTFGPLTSPVHMDGCDHNYCPSCLIQYVRFKVEEHEYPILCPLCVVMPDAGQRGMVTDGVLLEVQIDEGTWRRWNDLQFEKFSTKITCRGCSRYSYVDTMDYHAAEVIACPLPDCCFRWCKGCNKPVDEHGAELVHKFIKPPPTSRLFKMVFKLKNKVKSAGRKLRVTRKPKDTAANAALPPPPPHECEDGADLLFDVVRENGWKYCPGCNTPTERVTGCNHMTCSLCLSNWCYHCGLMSGAYTLRRELAANERLCYGLHDFE